MKMRPKICLILSAICLLSLNGRAEPVDLSAPNPTLGASDPYGYVDIWRELGEVDFGHSLALPLRVKFTTAPGEGGLLGPGFILPVLESRAYLLDEKTLTVRLLCGKALYFWHDKSNKTSFRTPNGEWKGYLDGNEFSIWRDDGWVLRYRNGKIVQLKTDQGRVLDWDYAGEKAIAIREGGNIALRIETTPTGAVNSIWANGKLYRLTYDKRPRVEVINGQTLLAGFDQSLNKIIWPDGKSETFSFATTASLNPSLLHTVGTGESIQYSWDPQTEQILTSGDWNYQIGSIKGLYQVPDLVRKNSNGETEALKTDSANGIVTAIRNGTTTSYSSFQSPGPLFGKLRTIEGAKGGKTWTIYHASYSASGKLLRELQRDTDGSTLVTNYSEDGKVVSHSLLPADDPIIIAGLQQKEKNLLGALASSTSQDMRVGVLKKLASFYLFEVHDKQKNAEVLSELPEDQSYVFKAQRICSDVSSNPEEKIKAELALLQEFPTHKPAIEAMIQAFKLQVPQYADTKVAQK